MTLINKNPFKPKKKIINNLSAKKNPATTAIGWGLIVLSFALYTFPKFPNREEDIDTLTNLGVGLFGIAFLFMSDRILELIYEFLKGLKDKIVGK